MREQAARKATSMWSAFTLGRKHPELTLVAVRETQHDGRGEWGIVVRDLRSSKHRIVLDEAEWERIKKNGLPPLGVSWGEPLEPIEERPPAASAPANVQSPYADDIRFNDVAGYLDGVVGEHGRQLETEMELEPAVPKPLSSSEIDVLTAAVMKGTPARVVNSWNVIGGEAEDLDRLIRWVIDEANSGDRSRLNEVLAGSADIDLSGGTVRLAARTRLATDTTAFATWMLDQSIESMKYVHSLAPDLTKENFVFGTWEFAALGLMMTINMASLRGFPPERVDAVAEDLLAKTVEVLASSVEMSMSPDEARAAIRTMIQTRTTQYFHSNPESFRDSLFNMFARNVAQTCGLGASMHLAFRMYATPYLERLKIDDFLADLEKSHL